jgi:hypothetical protein
MLLSVLPVLATPNLITCNHDAYQRTVLVDAPKFRRTMASDWQDPASGSPFRIFYDTTYVTSINNSLSCSQSGQQITWNGVRYTCTEDDIMTDAKRQVLIGTLENVRLYLQALLRVIPVDRLTATPAFPFYGAMRGRSLGQRQTVPPICS